MSNLAKENATRRTFIRGTSAAAAGVGAAMYVKPSLQSLGVTKAYASSGATKSSPALAGTSPGYWGNNGGAAGVLLWDTVNDPNWGVAGGYTSYNPFSNGNSGANGPTTFDSWAASAGASIPSEYTSSTTVWDLVNGGNGSDKQKAAGREFLVAYLNGAFYGLNFFPLGTTLSTTWLLSAWNCTVTYAINNPSNANDAYTFLASQLDFLNNAENNGGVASAKSQYNTGLSSAPAGYSCLPTLP